MFTQNNFTDSIFSGLICLDQNASNQFQPRLIMNDYSSGRKTLEFILDNLTTCETFKFAVAFLFSTFIIAKLRTKSAICCIADVLLACLLANIFRNASMFICSSEVRAFKPGPWPSYILYNNQSVAELNNNHSDVGR